MNSRLFLFNPTNEMAIANGQVSYMPPHPLKKLEEDLATLPWMLGKASDYILINKLQGNSLNHLVDMGWEIPKPVTGPDEISKNKEQKIVFEPWGWSPAVYRSFKPFDPLAEPKWHQHPFAQWKESLAQLLSRETGYQLLNTIRQIKAQSPNSYPLLFLPEQPLSITKITELTEISQTCTPPAIIKTPWSASGRGLYRIRNSNDNPAKSTWVKGMLKNQGKLYLEKMLNKIQDVSFQFLIEKDNTQYIKHNYFYANSAGQFAGCAIGDPVNKSKLFKDTPKVYEAIEQAAQLLKQGIENMQLNLHYDGPAGIDGIFFEDEHGCLKLQPCLEINLRYNMGLANVRLKERLHPEAKGSWETGIFKQEQWAAFCSQNMKEYPLKYLDNRLLSGFLPLINPDSKKLFGAWLHLH
jgi:hypothetical protein